MRHGELDEKLKTSSQYDFSEDERTFSLQKDGVRSVANGSGEERAYSYDEVKFYRVATRANSSNEEEKKLYFTAPAPTLKKYNRYRFKENDRCYFTHEFSRGEEEKIKRAIEEYSIPVIERERDLRGVKRHYRTFCEDGGLAHRIVALALFFFVLLIIGTIIMYLINYFLHTATDTLALVFGIFCLPCVVVVIVKSQELGSKVKIYDTGVYLKIRSKSGYGGTASPFAVETVYLTWSEVESVEKVQSPVNYIVQFRLGYRILSVPDFYGLYDYIALHFPEKCKRNET